jgi:hypothetical protein
MIEQDWMGGIAVPASEWRRILPALRWAGHDALARRIEALVRDVPDRTPIRIAIEGERTSRDTLRFLEP